MSVRLAELNVKRKTRDKLKKLKRELSYDQYINKLLGQADTRQDVTASPVNQPKRMNQYRK